MSERVVVVPSAVWWELPDGGGLVWQDSGHVATVTLTEDQMVLGGGPGTKWIWRSIGYNRDHGEPVTPITFDTTEGQPVTDPNARIGAYADATGTELPDGTDTFQHLQKPDLHPAGDPLAQFVKARIIDAETEPRHEFPRIYGLEAGPIAHRYAKHVRKDCVVYRQIVAEYLEEMAARRAEHPAEKAGALDRARGLRFAVLRIADRWSDHPDWRERW